MPASSLFWTLGDRWQCGSQGLPGTVTQTSCKDDYKSIIILQKQWAAQGLLSFPAQLQAGCQVLPLSWDTSQGCSSRLRDSLL